LDPSPLLVLSCPQRRAIYYIVLYVAYRVFFPFPHNNIICYNSLGLTSQTDLNIITPQTHLRATLLENPRNVVRRYQPLNRRRVLEKNTPLSATLIEPPLFSINSDLSVRYSFRLLTKTELPGVQPYYKTLHWRFWISSVNFFLLLRISPTIPIYHNNITAHSRGVLRNRIGRWHSASVTS